MLLHSFPAGGFDTNCYVLTAEPGGPCLIADPGQAATAPLLRLHARSRLSPQSEQGWQAPAHLQAPP